MNEKRDIGVTEFPKAIQQGFKWPQIKGNILLQANNRLEIDTKSRKNFPFKGDPSLKKPHRALLVLVLFSVSKAV